MSRMILRSLLFGAMCLAGWSIEGGLERQACAQYPSTTCRPRDYHQPDLFYNFYVPPQCGGMGAELYVAPLPVPPVVGHTHITYQPLMPHEMLYKHHRVYHRYYEGGRGFTRTSVRWW